MQCRRTLSLTLAALAYALVARGTARAAAAADAFSDTFAGATLVGWTVVNAGSPAGDRAWARGPQLSGLASRDADPRAFATANYEAAGPGGATADAWLISPPVTFENGQTFRFDAVGVDSGGFPDRLQVRLDLADGGAAIGGPATLAPRFSTLLLDVNPHYANPPAAGAFPTAWTPYAASVGGLPGPVTGRFAFRYFVEDSGPDGTRGSEIGVDNVRLAAGNTTAPEPAAVAPLALAAGLAARSRRRNIQGYRRS